MRKLWLDVETTGLDANVNGIIQLACIDDKTGAKFKINIKPFDGCVYDKGAEDVHGISETEIKSYTPEADALLEFVTFLKEFEWNGQFQIAGYNSRFDMEFVIALFKRNNTNFWKYFNYYDVDVFALVKMLDLSGEVDGKVSKKLTALCNTFDIKLSNAHDALADIKATKKLYKKITKRYMK